MNSLIIRVQTSVAGKQRKKSFFFMIHYPLYNNCHSKKVTKKSSFLLLIGFIYLTWHSKDHIILFFFLTIQGIISSKRSTFQSFIHWKYRSIKFFFSEEKKEWLWGLLYLLVFLLLSKSLELFELIHFGMAKNHDDAFEVFSLSPALRIALSCTTTTTTSSTVVMAIDSSVR